MIDWTEQRKKLIDDSAGQMVPSSVKLPVLPRVVTEFTRLSRDPDTSALELADLVESDASLTCELLRHLNSCAMGVRRKVSSVQQAIMLMGIRATGTFLATMALKKVMSSTKSRLINVQNFWNTNLERAIFARLIAAKLGASEHLAYAAGMMQDFLLPVLANEWESRYVDFLERQDHDPIDLAEFERQEFGWDHALAGAQIMMSWNFPDDLICCVALHHRGLQILMDTELAGTSAAATALAGMIPDPLRQTPHGLEQLQKLETVWKSFDLLETARRVQEEFFELAKGAENHFSLLRRCEKALVHHDA